MRNDLPKAVAVADVTVENNDAVTLHLDMRLDFAPGQFLMLWLPGLGEKPFSIAGSDGRNVLVTVRRRGPVSEKLALLKPGALLGARGPYGRGFKPNHNCCIVAGGIGVAAVAPLMDLYPHAAVFYGENTASSRVYRQRFPKVEFFTADNSEGNKGYPTEGLAALLLERRVEVVYCCGPEPMLVAAVRVCRHHGVRCEASLERYMKCAIGVCGACSCGGSRVCADGPVFEAGNLQHNTDFGKRHMDASGTWRAL